MSRDYDLVGDITLKDAKDAQKVKAVMNDLFNEVWVFDKKDPLRVSVSDWSYGNFCGDGDDGYNEEQIMNALEKVKPYVKSYDLRCEETGYCLTEDGFINSSVIYPKIAKKNLRNAGFSQKDVDKILRLVQLENVVQKNLVEETVNSMSR